MILPQELEVYYVIPAIRRELARALKKQGLSQKRISLIFGVTEACVSNYFKSKRGREVDFNPKILRLINSCADDIIKGNKCFINSVQCVCKEFRNDKCLCVLHKKIDNLTCKNQGCLL